MTETQAPWPARDQLRITRVRAIVTAPEGLPLVVVAVDTNEPGLTGLGCATFTQRFRAVAAAVDEHLAPMLIGRHPADITDITRMAHLSGYWRGGPVLNNALSGVDQALWDIAGKRAGMPVYELLGGRVRAAAAVYLHAGGASIDETLEQAQGLLAQGYRHVRLQVAGPGLGSYGGPGTAGGYPDAPYPDGWDVQQYLRDTPTLFARAREVLGEEPSLLHDVHHRLTVKQAIGLARALEPYRLFFLEDPIPLELYDRLPEIRAAAPMPLAVGEQVGSVPDAARLVLGGGVDLLRVHISAIGGLTPARQLVALCELTGVQTAWHAPADVSPVGAAANVALDVTTPAFGIQEGHVWPDRGARGLSGRAATGGRVHRPVRPARLGHRPRRGAGREVPADHPPARALGSPGTPPGRRDRSAVNRVLVTGVAGRLGRAVAELLAGQGIAVTGLDLVAPSAQIPVDRLVLGSATDPAVVRDALTGVDAVAHLAAIPSPDLGSPAAVFGENALGTFVVLSEAGQAGVGRTVLASSHSVLGFAFAQPPVRPLYLPVDHAHPLQVADPYALSKQADEATGQMLARTTAMTVVALRFPFLGGSADRLADFADRLRVEPAAGARPLWAYLEDRDAATACWLALTVPLHGYHLVTVANPQTLAARDTEDLLDEFFPQVPRRAPLPGRTVPWDISSATEVLGFQPVHHYPGR